MNKKNYHNIGNCLMKFENNILDFLLPFPSLEELHEHNIYEFEDHFAADLNISKNITTENLLIFKNDVIKNTIGGNRINRKEPIKLLDPNNNKSRKPVETAGKTSGKLNIPCTKLLNTNCLRAKKYANTIDSGNEKSTLQNPTCKEREMLCISNSVKTMFSKNSLYFFTCQKLKKSTSHFVMFSCDCKIVYFS